MSWHLPREQGRRLAAATAIAGLAFLAQGQIFTAASYTGTASIQSSQFRTASWCVANVYPATVLATVPAPRNYLRLDDTGAAATVADAAPSAPSGHRDGSATVFGQPGLLDCVTNTAVRLNGATGQPRAWVGGAGIATPGQNVFTLSAWVNVTSGQGRLISFGRTNAANTTLTNNNNDDRTLYVDAAGYLRFGINDNTAGGVPNGRYTIRSDAPITGARHHIAATLSAAGMKLYVDGVLQTDRNAAVTLGRNGYTGSWRVGFNNLTTAWSGITVNNQLPVATIDEVAIWHQALNDLQIGTLAGANHW